MEGIGMHSIVLNLRTLPGLYKYLNLQILTHISFFSILLTAGSFSNLNIVPTNIDEDGEAVRDNFNKFLSGLQGIMSTNRDQEELSIMNQR